MEYEIFITTKGQNEIAINRNSRTERALLLLYVYPLSA